MFKYITCGAFLIILLAVFLNDIAEFLQMNKEYSTTDAALPCSIIPITAEKEIVAEDINMINDHLAIISSDDRVRLWHFNDDGSAPRVGSPRFTPDGNIWTLDLSKTEP
jgi:hypothetical protein